MTLLKNGALLQHLGTLQTLHWFFAAFLLLFLGLFALNAYNPSSVFAKFDFNDNAILQQTSPRNACVPKGYDNKEIKQTYDIDSMAIAVYKEKIAHLLKMWEASSFLNNDTNRMSIASNPSFHPKEFVANMPHFPHPPHLEDCNSRSSLYTLLDTRDMDGRRPHWLPWKGQLGIALGENLKDVDVGEEMLYKETRWLEGPYPPWIQGADEDNLPMTRRVQRDIWLHQHPRNCSDPKIKFLLTKWDTRPNLGLGALVISMAGILANALEDGRVLVTDYFERADHDGCTGSTRSRWSCYFLPETSEECRQRALQLSRQKKAWNDRVIINAGSFSSSKIWFSKIPEYWGKPWERIQPTTEIDDEILLHHEAMDRRWWRSQAVRYLMRFPSKYTCNLLNKARHQAFGHEAASMILESPANEWAQITSELKEGPLEHLIWPSQPPWIPRPLISIHVRLGDKAFEMKMVDFHGYMKLAMRLRSRFPQARNVWLSTEMQDVIDQSKLYAGWNFYYSNVTRQTGKTSMNSYENALGQETSTSNAIVNLLMAADADFFIGALGSTWCILIDGLRCTGGKEMAGYLSVNKDRYW